MKTIIRKSLVAAAAVLTIAGAAGRAEASEPMKVNVPFAFSVGNTTLPSGRYLVEREDSAPSVLRIQNLDGSHTSMFVLTNPSGGVDPAGDHPSLTFTRTGDTYHLSDVWNGPMEGHSVEGNK